MNCSGKYYVAVDRATIALFSIVGSNKKKSKFNHQIHAAEPNYFAM